MGDPGVDGDDTTIIDPNTLGFAASVSIPVPCQVSNLSSLKILSSDLRSRSLKRKSENEREVGGCDSEIQIHTRSLTFPNSSTADPPLQLYISTEKNLPPQLRSTITIRITT